MKRGVGEGKEGKKMVTAAPQSESTYAGSYGSRLLFLLQMGILGEVSGEGFSRMFTSSPGVSVYGQDLH